MFPLLETLVAVYEVGQFTLAADELKVSQSTVSSRIAQLEQMVGAPLFVRNAKSDVTPTQAGRMLYQTAIGIDGLWRDTREQIARVQEAREPLAVSFSHTTAAILLPKALPVVFCQVGVGRFGVSFSPCERRVSGRFGVGRSCWLLVIALVIA